MINYSNLKKENAHINRDIKNTLTFVNCSLMFI